MKFKGGSARKTSAARKSDRSRSRSRNQSRPQIRPPPGHPNPGESRFLVVELLEIQPDGLVRARILSGDKKVVSRLPELIEIPASSRPVNPGLGRLAPGDRIFVLQHGRDDFEMIRPLPKTPANATGVFERTPTGGKIRPLDKTTVTEWLVRPEDTLGALAGELVAFVPESHHRDAVFAKVRERLGLYGSVASISTAVLRSLEIPLSFTAELEAAAEAAAHHPIDFQGQGRSDLRQLPFVTIDGSDARDFDDAVCAREDSADNPGGMVIWVAIADVAFYVPHGSPLDLEARERGNSVYLPDRVIPMLPEALSNGACSLLPHQDRAVMVAEMRIDSAGKLVSRGFSSAVIHSRARLTYEQVQAVMEGSAEAQGAAEGGAVGGAEGGVVAALVAPLQAAYRILLAARLKRHALDLELPERQVILEPSGQGVQSVGIRPRLEAHRLIEELMILANIAAAEVLEAHRLPCIYRIHDRPSPEKFLALATALAGFGYRLDKAQGLSSEQLVRILHRAAGKPEHDLIHGLLLRTQALAIYSPENIGHFGLALTRYAHFTSPIRRYADLMVHRFLKIALKLEAESAAQSLLCEDAAGIARHISAMERRAVAAERGVKDRLLAAFMAPRRGAEFTARVSSVTKFGLFVTLDETGADGLVPMSSLPNDYYRYDAKSQRLVGDRSRRSFRLGERLLLTLDEVEIVTGRIKLSFVESLKN